MRSNKIIADEMATLLQLKFNAQKRYWFWTGLIVAITIAIISIDAHLTTATFSFASLLGLSFSFSYWFLSVRRLVVCTRFLKSKIKNKPTSLLKQEPVCYALKITARYLHQFCLSNSFVFFGVIAFLANQSGDLFTAFFYNLMMVFIFSGIIYAISLLISHAQLVAVLGHPILSYLSAFKLTKPVYFPIHTSLANVDTDTPDYSLTIYEIQEAILENWMHHPMNPASAEYQIWKKH